MKHKHFVISCGAYESKLLLIKKNDFPSEEDHTQNLVASVDQQLDWAMKSCFKQRKFY